VLTYPSLVTEPRHCPEVKVGEITDCADTDLCALVERAGTVSET